MKRQTVFFVLCALTLLFASLNPTFAHDEGHGPKISDAGKRGGIVASVIRAKDVKKGAGAELLYKAELVRSEDGTVKVYVYDKEMNVVDLAKFDSKAKGVVESKKQKKWTQAPFDLALEGDAFSGKAPAPAKKPFNIDVKIKMSGQELLAAFDNLD